MYDNANHIFGNSVNVFENHRSETGKLVFYAKGNARLRIDESFIQITPERRWALSLLIWLKF